MVGRNGRFAAARWRGWRIGRASLGGRRTDNVSKGKASLGLGLYVVLGYSSKETKGQGELTCANEENIAEFHLGALVFEACLKVCERNNRRLKTVKVLDRWIRLLLAPTGDIDEHTPSHNALLSPRLNTIHQRLLPVLVTPVSTALDILDCHAAVEFGLLLIAKVAQPVPLAGNLGVEGPDIIVDDARGLLEEVVVKELALEEAGFFTLSVERPVERDSVKNCQEPSLEFFFLARRMLGRLG